MLDLICESNGRYTRVGNRNSKNVKRINDKTSIRKKSYAQDSSENCSVSPIEKGILFILIFRKREKIYNYILTFSVK